MKAIKEFNKEKLLVKVFNNREELGITVAEDVADVINNLAQSQDEIRIVFAAAPSQNEFLEELAKKDIDWQKVVAFHMDEYIGLEASAPHLFGKYLDNHIFSKVNFKEIHYINSQEESVEEECFRYADLLTDKPIDICFMGIGENGHLAFNDPPVADFDDKKVVKIVELDEKCRIQQVNDGCFETIEDVPKKAITLTIPVLMSAKYLSIVAPGKTKAAAIKDTLNSDVSTSCPATILRTHNNAAKLYIDKDSYSMAYGMV
ncbi:MAG: glucosamine-6-phosphate deaminase [Ignavibacteria bacterium]